MEQIERYRGSLLGLAAGDALGTTLEFMSPGSFKPISDIVGGGPFGLEAGQWTDDTSMALCLAESLLDCRGFDPVDQLRRYVRWYREGYMSSTGRCFDIGNTTRAALQQFERTGEPYPSSTNPRTAGNGSIMRLASVPLFYARNPDLAIQMAADSSRTTHGAADAVDACRYLAALLVGAVGGVAKVDLLSDHFDLLTSLQAAAPLSPGIAAVASGSFKRRNPPEIKGTGHVVASLEAALWALHHGGSFREGALLAVNLGDDADTTGAVYGQLAGALYGEQGIPGQWRASLHDREFIESRADRLHAEAMALG
jgi:ADP-ribosylglycohydrolase